MADYELGGSKIASRRIPCSCQGYITQSKLSIENRYKGASKECIYWNIFKQDDKHGWNDSRILSFKQKNDNEKMTDILDVTLQGLGETLSDSVCSGCYGAVPVDDCNVYSYYIVKWNGSPFQVNDQREFIINSETFNF